MPPPPPRSTPATRAAAGAPAGRGTAAGAYTVKLTFPDAQGATSRGTHAVTVTTPPNATPTAAFTSSASYLHVNLDGSTSSDPDGSIAGYAWDFGDATTGTGATPAHT